MKKIKRMIHNMLYDYHTYRYKHHLGWLIIANVKHKLPYVDEYPYGDKVIKADDGSEEKWLM